MFESERETYYCKRVLCWIRIEINLLCSLFCLNIFLRISKTIFSRNLFFFSNTTNTSIFYNHQYAPFAFNAQHFHFWEENNIAKLVIRFKKAFYNSRFNLVFGFVCCVDWWDLRVVVGQSELLNMEVLLYKRFLGLIS